MRFVRAIHNEKEFIGVLSKDGKRVVMINDLVPELKADTMIELIENINEDQKLAIEKSMTDLYIVSYDISKLKICSPIKKPIHDVLCVGVNYKEHLEETQQSFDKGLKQPEKTVYFSKRATEIIGPDDVIIGQFNLDEKLDYEVELAVIIGKRGKNITKDEAEEYIFGYSIINDLSSRQLQKEHVQWYRGKSLDTYTSMGPCIVTRDEIPFPVELNIRSTVNGELRQNSNTKMFLTNIASIISEFSQGITLEPGDIIATGTPSGVGMGFNPPKYMKKNDVVICEIEGIGTLRNIVK